MQHLHTIVLLKLVLPHTIWLTERFPTFFCFVFCYWRSSEECIQSSSHRISHLLSITPTQGYYNNKLRLYSSEPKPKTLGEKNITNFLNKPGLWSVSQMKEKTSCWLYSQEYSIWLFEFHTFIMLKDFKPSLLVDQQQTAFF